MKSKGKYWPSTALCSPTAACLNNGLQKFLKGSIKLRILQNVVSWEQCFLRKPAALSLSSRPRKGGGQWWHWITIPRPNHQVKKSAGLSSKAGNTSSASSHWVPCPTHVAGHCYNSGVSSMELKHLFFSFQQCSFQSSCFLMIMGL